MVKRDQEKHIRWFTLCSSNPQEGTTKDPGVIPRVLEEIFRLKEQYNDRWKGTLLKVFPFLFSSTTD